MGNDEYDVAVWTWDGDVIKQWWNVPWETVERVRKEYADEPTVTVVVTPCREP